MLNIVLIFDSFWVRFGIDFGVIRGGFGEPKSVILGIFFLMILGCRSKIGPEQPRSGQEPPKNPQERPKSAQERPKSG